MKELWNNKEFQIAIFTAIITAIIAVIQAFLSLIEKKKKFTFERLKMAKELIDDIYEQGTNAPKALLMIDERLVEYKHNNKTVGNKDEIVDALKNKKVTDDKYDFIRDCFDELFFFMVRIELSIESKLIKFEDIEPYFSYYVKERILKDEELYTNYSRLIHVEKEIKHFINRFNKKNCSQLTIKLYKKF